MHLVNFAKGARTKFHTHNKEQTIIAYAGVGVQATEHGVNVIRPGDVVYIPAGEKHYHGAAKDSEFSQISVFAEDHDSQWLE